MPPLGRRYEHDALRWWAGLTFDETGVEVHIVPSEPPSMWPGYFDVRVQRRYGGYSRGPMLPAEVRAFLAGIGAALPEREVENHHEEEMG